MGVGVGLVRSWLLRGLRRFGRVPPADAVYVSEAASPCLRWVFFQRVRAARPSGFEGVLPLGTELHAIIQGEAVADGWMAEVGVSLPLGDFRLVGRADLVRDDAVIELKTVSRLPEEPRRSHVLQLQAYMQLLHAREGYIVYVSRADGSLKVFEVKPSKHALKEVVERAKTLWAALQSRRPPPPERGPWCRACPWRSECGRSGGRNRIKRKNLIEFYRSA